MKKIKNKLKRGYIYIYIFIWFGEIFFVLLVIFKMIFLKEIYIERVKMESLFEMDYIIVMV